MHQRTHQGLQDGGRHCPGCHLERRWTCVGSVPQDLCPLTQGELFRRQGMGAWGGDSPCLGLYLRRYAYRLQRERWMPWCLKQGRGFSGFMSGHRTRRANQVPSPLLERPQSKNVQLSPDPLIKDTALESSWPSPGPLGALTPLPNKGNSVKCSALLPLLEFHLKLRIQRFVDWTHENFLPQSLTVSWAPATVLVFELEA